MADEEPVVFWVHRTSGDKLWDEPPAADLAQYETWEFNPATGEVNQQPEPGSPLPALRSWRRRLSHWSVAMLRCAPLVTSSMAFMIDLVNDPAHLSLTFLRSFA